MEHSLNEQQKSMMQSVSKNIQGFQLNPNPLYSSCNGQIFQLTHPNRHSTLVLKVVFKKHKHNNYKHEKKIHNSLKNRYIVQLQNCFQDEACSYLVMEHCKNGSLESLMNKKKIPIETVKQYTLQIAKGIHYLHKNKIIHHGINPTNILLTSDDSIKICDFGSSSRFDQGKMVKGCQNNLEYAPPEAIQSHSQKFDVWSLGCLIYEMATGTIPFNFKNWKQHATTLTKLYLENFKYDQTLPFSLIHLLKKIFVFDKQERISIDQLIKHNFFTGQPLVQSEKNGQPEERPLAVRKQRSKTSMRSVQSRISRQNKENKDHVNRAIAKRIMPNYKDIVDKKFKKTQLFEKGRPESREVTKTASEGFKQKQIKSSVHSATLSRKIELSPLNTRNMKINPLRIKNTEIRIDKNGFTRENLNTEIIINISCDGQLIKMKKGKKQKHFTFQSLPPEYFHQYQQCKKYLSEIQAQQPQVTFTDRNFIPGLALQLKIMYNNKISIELEHQLNLRDLSPQQFMANIKNIKEEYFNPLKNLYLRLMELHPI